MRIGILARLSLIRHPPMRLSCVHPAARLLWLLRATSRQRSKHLFARCHLLLMSPLPGGAVVGGCVAAPHPPICSLITLPEIDLPSVLSAMGATLTLVMPVNHESDSVDQIQRLADQFGNGCGYIVVRNAAHSRASRCLNRPGAGATQRQTRRARNCHVALAGLAG